MKIWCTVFRKNGTYQTTPVKAGEEDFELDGKRYEVKGYYIGKVFGLIHVLRALYFEGYPLPIKINIDEQMEKTKGKRLLDGITDYFRIDCTAIRNVTNKKILNVFGAEELTKLEKILIMVAVGMGAIGIVNIILTMTVINALGL